MEFWRHHPQLAELLRGGRLDVAHFNPEQGAVLNLLQSGETLGPGPLETPLIVLANHAFSRLRHDTFAVVDGQLLECRLTLDGAAAEDATDPLRVGQDYRPLDGPFYDDPLLDGLLQAYAEEIGDGHVLIPMGALGALRTLIGLAPRGLLVLCTDPGPVHPEAMRHTLRPIPRVRMAWLCRSTTTPWDAGRRPLGGSRFSPGLLRDP